MGRVFVCRVRFVARMLIQLSIRLRMLIKVSIRLRMLIKVSIRPRMLIKLSIRCGGPIRVVISLICGLIIGADNTRCFVPSPRCA